MARSDNVSLDANHPTTLLLSAETAEALDAATQKLAAWMSEKSQPGHAAWPLPEVAAALRERCRMLPQRRAIRVESWQDALAALDDKARWATATALPGSPKLILSFPGQGSLRPGVLSRLLAGLPAWARHLRHYADLARDISGFDCAGWLADPRADADSVLRDNGKTQLAIFCVGAALGRWLLDLGPHPDGFLGHSLGEWMSANLAGVLTDEHAVRAVYHRGRLMQTTGPGAALIVRATPEALQPQLPDDITLACVNAPNLCLLSGRPEAVAICNEKLAAARLITRPAPIHVAVHSPAMDAILDPFLAELAPLDFAAPKNRLLSPVTGEWMPEALARDRAYWARQLRQPVRFDKAAATLLAEPSAVILEVGMGAALTSLITTQTRGRSNLRALALLGRDEPPAEGYAPARVHQTLGELWAAGVAVNLVGEATNRHPLPGLPF
ncbi:MAG: acyltransferase domain-containing protein [Deltaproteobacteria bacterium]|nr:acyltransferase domain-containing protein [Deltaproteobacteria bacterium]